MWLPHQKLWNASVVNPIFPHVVANAILNTHLIASVVSYSRVWACSKSGTYNVKYACYLAMDKMIDRDHLKVEGDWSLIWNLDVPPRVKIFLWRACRDCLPTRCQLQKKDTICSSLYVMCDHNLENLWHLFTFCPLTIECWEDQHLLPNIEDKMQTYEILKDICLLVL